jgi:hypothetical protein
MVFQVRGTGKGDDEMPPDFSLPPIPGDPAGMRALAASLRTNAEGIAVVSAQAAATIDGLEFYGPAADRIDGQIRTTARGAGRLAEQLLATAALLERSAADVEAEQAAQQRELERLLRDFAGRPAA